MGNEIDEVLVEDGSPRKRLRATLRRFKDFPLLDIRYWYEDKKTKEYRPTAKGISLTKSNYLSVRSISIDHHEEVMEYLDVGSLSVSNEGDRSHLQKSSLNKYGTINEVNTFVDFIKPSSALYSVEYKGAVAEITLNKAHPFVRRVAISSERSDPNGIQNIAELLVAMDLSIKTQVNVDGVSVDVLSEMFGFGLSKYSRKIAEVNV